MGDEGETKGEGPAGPVYGPVYDLWESCLEKLKILNYDSEFCRGGCPFIASILYIRVTIAVFSLMSCRSLFMAL